MKSYAHIWPLVMSKYYFNYVLSKEVILSASHLTVLDYLY